MLKRTIIFVFNKLRIFIITNQIKFYSRKGIFPINIKNSLGFGAKLIWYLEIFFYCKEKNLKPIIKFSYKDSKKDEDYFSAFFKSNVSEYRKLKYISIRHIEDLGLDQEYKKKLNIKNAHEFLTKNVLLHKELEVELDQFLNENFNGNNILGVHFRNTDKGSEAPATSYENVLKNIHHVLKQYPELNKIFITSDDRNFIEFMQNSRLSSLLIIRTDSFRSSDGVPIHCRNDVNKYSINKDAVLNMMILTKVAFIIKTPSFLSSCAILFKPDIPFMMLCEPFKNKLWFPESDLINCTALYPAY